MYAQTVDLIADQPVAKLEGRRQSLLSHLVRSILAGMYWLGSAGARASTGAAAPATFVKSKPEDISLSPAMMPVPG